MSLPFFCISQLHTDGIYGKEGVRDVVGGDHMIWNPEGHFCYVPVFFVEIKLELKSPPTVLHHEKCLPDQLETQR